MSVSALTFLGFLISISSVQSFASQVIEEVDFPTQNTSIERSHYKVFDDPLAHTQTLEIKIKDQKRSLTFGSLVKPKNTIESTILSVAYAKDIADRQIDLSSPLFEIHQTAEVEKTFLKDIKDYVILLEDEDLNLKFSLNDSGQIQTFDSFVVFDVVDLKKLKNNHLSVIKKVALQVEDSSVFGSAVAILESGVVKDITPQARVSHSQFFGFFNKLKNSFLNSDSKIVSKSSGIGSIEDVVCTQSGSAQILSQDLSKSVGSLQNGERVRLVQNFTKLEQHKEFVEIGFGNAQRGFISQSDLKPKSSCSYKISTKAHVATESSLGTPEEKLESLSTPSGKFPTVARGSVSYRSGMRAFGSNRSGGARLHAACDIYRVKNERTVAVESGTVIRGPYYFYEGTYAKEVKLNSGPVIRYGEITASNSGAATGAFKTGAVIGYIGKTHCCTPMLHFEKYAGTKSGSLTGGGKYQRRSDLQNPTSYLQRLEKSTFGASY